MIYRYDIFLSRHFDYLKSFVYLCVKGSQPQHPTLMIDRRNIKTQHQEIDIQLKNLSDTEIMLEFSRLLASIYPHLVMTHNHCYDPYDDISENLYFNFVHSTFSGKYGSIIDRQETHKYEPSLL